LIYQIKFREIAERNSFSLADFFIGGVFQQLKIPGYTGLNGEQGLLNDPIVMMIKKIISEKEWVMPAPCYHPCANRMIPFDIY
jgi:hypothetical protein